MKEITLRVKDNKFRFFMELIKSLTFVQVEDKQRGDTLKTTAAKTPKKQNPLDEMFGLWKNRQDISLEKIRQQAWPRRA